MTYTMVEKSPFKFPTERYLNIVKRGYKDCNLDKKYLKKINLKDFKLTFRSKYRAADIEPKKKSIVPGGLFKISKSDEKKLDFYEDFPTLYKKHYFYHYGKRVMTYTMAKKSVFKFPTERYLNIIKRGYKDCGLDNKYLQKGLLGF